MSFDELHKNLNLFWVVEAELRKNGEASANLIEKLPESFKEYYNILKNYKDKKKK